VAGDSAATWSAVRDAFHCSSRPVYSDSQCQLLVVGFSQFFADKLRRTRELIAVSLTSTVSPVYHDRRHVAPKLPPTSPSEVLKILKSSRLKQSPVELLPTALLRSSADTLSPIFAHIANLSFAECRFPAAFKIAQVTPLLKKPGRDKEQMSNYRPISNLSTASKVIERLVLDRLRPHHLLDSSNFVRLQSAYRCGCFMETALLHVMDNVYTASNNKKATALVCLDISAAFDAIDHSVQPNGTNTGDLV